MTHSEGVPLTRELLEALMNVAGVLLDQAVGNEPSPGRAEEAARELADACAVLVSACGDSLLVDACAAPLAESGAAAPDAELASLLEDLREGAELWGERRADTWTQSGAENADKACDEVCARIHAHVAQVKREAVEQALHTAASTRSCNVVPAPAPDAALVQKCGACGHDRVAHRGRTGQCIGAVAPDSLPCYCREFVAESSDAPAPAPAPGDAGGETDLDFESWLDLYSNAWLNYGRDPVNATDGGYDYGHRSAIRSALLRLYRAATGEVVGTGRVYRDLHSSMHVVPEQWHIPQDAVHPVHGIPVRVVRRDKEGV